MLILKNRQIAEACGPGVRGSLDEAGIIRRDLNGDGAEDLVISHAYVRCAVPETAEVQGARPPSGPGRTCSDGICPVRIFLRDGRFYRLRAEFSAADIAVGPEGEDGTPPEITGRAWGGEPFSVRWSGTRFE